MNSRARQHLVVQRAVGGDVLPGDFVRLISGSCLGVVESIDNDHAVVLELPRGREACKSIVPVSLLMRVVPW